MNAAHPSASRAVAAAIVLGSALVGAGLFLGLRARPVAVQQTEGAQHPRDGAPPASGASAPPDDDLVRAATREASAAFEAGRQRLVEACWAPSAARVGSPAKVRWIYDVTFGPDGRELARGIREGDPARADAAQCARRLPLELAIAPPGRTVAVTLDVCVGTGCDG